MDSVETAVLNKLNAELTQIVCEQQRIILVLQESDARQQRIILDLQREVERVRGALHSSETGKPKGMPGNK